MTPRVVIAAVFALIAGVAIGAEWLARRRASTVRPAGVTLAAALRTTGGRAVILACWLWAGWHFLAR